MNRRDFIKLSAVAAGSALVHGPAAGAGANKGVLPAGPVSDAAVKAMEFTFRCETEIVTPPKHGKEISLWAPLPQSDGEQEITRCTVQADAPFRIHEEPYYGNTLIHIGPARLRPGDKVALSVHVRRRAAGTIEAREEDEKKHLSLSPREQGNDAITKFVDAAVGGEKDPLEVGRKVYSALVEFLTYDKEILGCGEGRSVWTFEQRRGRCDDFHSLFRTMMVSRGIPVRWEQGIALPYPSAMAKSGTMEGDCTGAHCWVLFFIGDGKWVPADVSEANKRKDLRDYFFGTLSPNRVKMSIGREIVLRPRQGGEPLNTFPFAYAEADGAPLIYRHNYRNTIRYELRKIEL